MLWANGHDFIAIKSSRLVSSTDTQRGFIPTIRNRIHSDCILLFNHSGGHTDSLPINKPVNCWRRPVRNADVAIGRNPGGIHYTVLRTPDKQFDRLVIEIKQRIAGS